MIFYIQLTSEQHEGQVYLLPTESEIHVQLLATQSLTTNCLLLNVSLTDNMNREKMFFQIVAHLQRSFWYINLKKNLGIGGPVQFRLMFFKGPVCVPLSLWAGSSWTLCLEEPWPCTVTQQEPWALPSPGSLGLSVFSVHLHSRKQCLGWFHL